ncbi:MAG: VOC family protein [Solirubrobacteraceae bacterium]
MPRDDAQVQSGHVGIVVERYEGAIERLRAEGHEIDARAAHWGSPRAYVRDPAGHLVELMAFAPGADAAGRRPPESAGRAPSA